MDESTINADASADLTIDVSDLLGVNQAFLADADPELQAELIDAHCNKIGTECCC